MATRRLTFELPAELIEQLGSAKEAEGKAKEALVLELLREGRISQGKAAELLNLTRWEVLDLMAQYRVPSEPSTPEALDAELATARRLAREHKPA